MPADWTPVIVALAGFIALMGPAVVTLILAMAHTRQLNGVQQQLNGAHTLLQAKIDALQAKLDASLQRPPPPP